VQPALLLDQGISRTDMQMIGIGKFHLAVDRFQILGTQRTFDGGLGTNIHKNGGLHRSMRASEHAPPGIPLLFNFNEFKHFFVPLTDIHRIPDDHGIPDTASASTVKSVENQGLRSP
jgi:hypothetical protein